MQGMIPIKERYEISLVVGTSIQTLQKACRPLKYISQFYHQSFRIGTMADGDLGIGEFFLGGLVNFSLD